jgi:hypothetical protein
MKKGIDWRVLNELHKRRLVWHVMAELDAEL